MNPSETSSNVKTVKVIFWYIRYENDFDLKVYKSGDGCFKTFIKTESGKLIVRSYSNWTEIPIPGMLISFLESEIFVSAKRSIVFEDQCRFKKAKTD